MRAAPMVGHMPSALWSSGASRPRSGPAAQATNHWHRLICPLSSPALHAADDPVTLGLLREAQQESDLLRHRLEQAEGRAVALLQDNISLKKQLGLPVEAEQAALAACTGAALPPLAAVGPHQGQPAAVEEGGNAGGVASQGGEPALPGEDGGQEQPEQPEQQGEEDEEQEEAAAENENAAPDGAAPSAARAGARRRRSGRA